MYWARLYFTPSPLKRPDFKAIGDLNPIFSI